MARIQKKKPTLKHKKKAEEGAEFQAAAAQSEVTEDKLSVSESTDSNQDTDKQKKQKKPPVIMPPPVVEQTAIMKLTEKYFGTWIQFFREVKIELGKVTWPSRKQTIGSTAVVIIFVIMISLFLGAVDFGLSNIVRFIL